MLIGTGGFGWAGDPVITELRLLRTVSAATVGGSLALAGVLLQSMLRNPLAAPDLLGVSAGASLGVSAAAWASYTFSIGAAAFTGPAAAVVGAFGALAVLALLARRSGGFDTVSMVLSGVVIAVICGAGSTLFRAIMPPDPARPVERWLFGSIRDAHPIEIAGSGVVLFLALAWSLLAARRLDAAALGEDEARGLGVGLQGLWTGQFLAAGLLAAGAVMLAGPIGFVGLVAPHAVRLIAGPGHRVLLPAATLAGGALVVAADAAVRTWTAETGRLPIGVLTSLVGGPVFLLLLRSRSGGSIR